MNNSTKITVTNPKVLKELLSDDFYGFFNGKENIYNSIFDN